GGQLPESPDGGVERGEYPDLSERESGGREQQREQAPGQAVVEVVDHAGLRGRRQRRLPVRDERGDAAGRQVRTVCTGGVITGLVPGVSTGLADEERRETEAEGGVGEGEQERRRPQPVLGGERAGGGGRRGDGEVAGGFVEAHGQASAVWGGGVGFTEAGGGPGQSLG